MDGNEEFYDQYEVEDNYCPKCGKVLSFENDTAKGFCAEYTANAIFSIRSNLVFVKVQVLPKERQKYLFYCSFTHQKSPNPLLMPQAASVEEFGLFSFPNCKRFAGLQFGMPYKSRLLRLRRKSIIPIITMPCSLRHSLILSFTTIIFLKESGMFIKGFCSCLILLLSGIANAD